MTGLRLMRLTWNSNGWQYPSGRSWNNKVQSPANHAYEHVHGYGFEEWLFNPRYSKDGIVYGYINGAERVSIETEIIPKAYLYTIEGVTKQRILLGYIENLSIIWEEEDIITGRKLFDYYFNDALAELQKVNGDYKDLMKYQHKYNPNVKFKQSDLYLYPQMQYSKFLDQRRFNRFVPHHLSSEDEKNLLREIHTKVEFRFESGSAKQRRNRNGRSGTSENTEVNNFHAEMSELVEKFLLKTGYVSSRKDLSVERTRVGDSIVDIAAKVGAKYDLFEIKTYNSGRLNIRSAIGQLIDYAFFDPSVSIRRLIVVGPVHLTRQEKQYLSYLNKITNFELQYWYFDKANMNQSNQFTFYR